MRHAIRLTRTAIAPTAHIGYRKRDTMPRTTKRALVAAGALTATGLFGSVQAQGVPTVHREVVLVDTTSDIITSETTFDDMLYGDAHTSATTLYNEAVTAFGGPEADTLLGTTVLSGANDLFDGAYNSFNSGVLLDAWAAEDEFNQLIGVPSATSQADILADITNDHIVLPAGDSLPLAGTAFDTDLMNLASGDYANAATEFTNYLDGLSDLGSLSDGLGGLGGDLTSLLDGLLGFL
jgi:hypothetical protein